MQLFSLSYYRLLYCYPLLLYFVRSWSGSVELGLSKSSAALTSLFVCISGLIQVLCIAITTVIIMLRFSVNIYQLFLIRVTESVTFAIQHNTLGCI